MLNVLVVDDIRFIRLGVKRLLEPRNLNVIEASSYNGAINIMKQVKIDILLLDLNLNGSSDMEVGKGTNGIDLLRYLKSNNMEMPYVIVVSGNLSEERVMEAYDLNVKKFITKSCIIDNLQNAISDAITELSNSKSFSNVTEMTSFGRKE